MVSQARRERVDPTVGSACFAIDAAAIASVVATAAPRTKPSYQSNPGRMWGARCATVRTVNPTSPNARRAMLTRLYENSRYDVSHAAE